MLMKDNTTKPLPEVWLRGPIELVPDLLQPVAHALLEANEELHRFLTGFPEEKLWERPAGLAAIAFHLQHIRGVLDRLFSYANGAAITPEQLSYISSEGTENKTITLSFLLATLEDQILAAIEQLKNTDGDTLTTFRGVGRKQLPSTVLGLLFHAAEHTMRHTGQLLVTARVLKEENVIHSTHT